MISDYTAMVKVIYAWQNLPDDWRKLYYEVLMFKKKLKITANVSGWLIVESGNAYLVPIGGASNFYKLEKGKEIEKI